MALTSDIQTSVPLASEDLESILEKANERLLRHREWLSKLPRDSAQQILSTTTTSAKSLITQPPALFPRQNPLTGCNDISSTAFNAGANSASSVLSISLASAASSASVTILSLKDAITSVQSSASLALSSATSSMLAAQISMDSVISMSERNASIIVSSAADMVASANAAANEAKINASAAIQRAEASIVSIRESAEASIIASQTAAMNTTKFALSLTFSILASSILTIILFYTIIRLRKRRREQRQAELKEKIHLRNITPPPMPPIPPIAPLNLSEIRISRQPEQQPNRNTGYNWESTERSDPNNLNGKRPELTPIGRNGTLRYQRQSNDDRRMYSFQQNSSEVGITRSITHSSIDETPGQGSRENLSLRDRSNTFGDFASLIPSPLPIQKPTSMLNDSSTQNGSSIQLMPSIRRPTQSRKPTLQYDPDRPEDPPTWLDNETDEESVVELCALPLKSPDRPIPKETKGTPVNVIGAAI
ncbi:putative Bgh-specific protein [Blumeria hordei DH14]|uniref:Putative Bgh-specific protein n=1 Tax=Blumeria graminis f. sp. hordei (strain DH14) TaxID=546991 RepID=N1JI05_BLUG1|nr:putative Bgh-specific protein [Blumeria hordei DH14]